MSLMLTIPIGAALIAVGIGIVIRCRDKDGYFGRATEAGIDPAKLDDVYLVYRTNRSLLGNLAIWLGAGLITASVILPLL